MRPAPQRTRLPTANVPVAAAATVAALLALSMAGPGTEGSAWPFGAMLLAAGVGSLYGDATGPASCWPEPPSWRWCTTWPASRPARRPTKDAGHVELVAGVRAAATGRALLAPSVTRRLIEEFAARPERSVSLWHAGRYGATGGALVALSVPIWAYGIIALLDRVRTALPRYAAMVLLLTLLGTVGGAGFGLQGFFEAAYGMDEAASWPRSTSTR